MNINHNIDYLIRKETHQTPLIIYIEFLTGFLYQGKRKNVELVNSAVPVRKPWLILLYVFFSYQLGKIKKLHTEFLHNFDINFFF